MIIYNQAFDVYHTLYRILLLLSRIPHGQIEVDKLKILDFYLVFPEELKKISSLPRNIKVIFKSIELNPYNSLVNPKHIFDRMKSYQELALNMLCYSNIINNDWKEKKYINLLKLNSFPESFLVVEDDLVIQTLNKILNSDFYKIPLTKKDGLKHISNLLEYKYDYE